MYKSLKAHLGQGQDLIMSIQIYLKYKYTYENAGFCILCIDDFFIHFMDIHDNFNPAIIVQGGWFAMDANPDAYRAVTERAAKVGYDILMVSVIRFSHAL